MSFSLNMCKKLYQCFWNWKTQIGLSLDRCSFKVLFFFFINFQSKVSNNFFFTLDWELVKDSFEIEQRFAKWLTKNIIMISSEKVWGTDRKTCIESLTFITDLAVRVCFFILIEVQNIHTDKCIHTFKKKELQKRNNFYINIHFECKFFITLH